MKRRIETVFLHVTKACDLRCQYCYFSASVPDPDEMSRGDYARLWPSLVGVGPQKAVFTGGEPFLRHDLLDLIADLASVDRGHLVLRCLNTNGMTMTAPIARRMVGLVDEVRVSLDGVGELHDRHRGRGSFATAAAALSILQAEGFEPKVLVTVTADTLGGVPALVDWLATQRLTRVRFNPVRLTGRASGNRALEVNPAALAAALAPGRAPASHPLPTSCGAGHFVNVMPNGDVFPCHVLTDAAFRIGNLRRDSLEVLTGAGSLLDELRRVNLRDLANQSPELRVPLAATPCLGVVSGAPTLRRVLRLQSIA